MNSVQYNPSASPDFNHSFVMMSTDAVSAVIDDRASDRVCFKLEKSRSTEMLTPGMARLSRATRAIYFKVPAFSCHRGSMTRLVKRGKTNLPPRERIIEARCDGRDVPAIQINFVLAINSRCYRFRSRCGFQGHGHRKYRCGRSGIVSGLCFNVCRRGGSICSSISIHDVQKQLARAGGDAGVPLTCLKKSNARCRMED